MDIQQALSGVVRLKGVHSLQLRRSVKQFVRDVEAAYGHEVEDGYNPDIAFMAHMWEPLRYHLVLDTCSVHRTVFCAIAL